ncbi:SUMF1/EgtB/PvdO family nonheme iron enzyme [Actinoplanes sp. NPDC051861]|uniref:formylglycine-generating enzyme family protein n=1 Tax=Actinoplanes sp. NPDC051861 TaxID=3155170 RepID=UPI0034471F8A
MFRLACDSRLARHVRIRALCVASRLRDPRFFGADGQRIAPDLSLVVVPGSTGRVGTDEPLPQREPKRVPSSSPVEVTVTPFEVSRFPVTNQEYRLFLEAGGYHDPRWWAGAEAARWRTQDADFVDELVRLWEERKNLDFGKEFREREFARYAGESQRVARRIMRRDRPLFWEDARFDLPTAPVVGVNLWEAQAYCRWFQERLRSRDLIGPADEVRVPTEIEWEWAAGAYWTGTRRETNPAKCLTRDFTAGGTATITHFGAIPVGFFSLGGPVPQQPEDMAGNVWEWVSSRSLPWTTAEDREALGGMAERGVRGGSWYSSEPLATHVSFRLNDVPCNAYWDLGFRIVVRRAR